MEAPNLGRGLGLTASLWLLNSLQDSIDGSMVTSAVVLGAGVWWWRHRLPEVKSTAAIAVSSVDRRAVVTALEELSPLLATLATEGAAAADAALGQTQVDSFTRQRSDLLAALDRTDLRLALVGAPGTGKTTVASYLASQSPQTQLSDIPASITLPATVPLTVTEQSRSALAVETDTLDWTGAIADQDALFYLVTEDLTASAQADLTALTTTGHAVVLVLNKQDHYLPEDRATILERLRQRAAVLPHPVTVAAIAAAPNPIKVRTHQAEGTIEERWETPAPDLAALEPLLAQWATEQAHLVVQTTHRQAQQLRRQIQTALNQLRRDRARPLVEQMQWTAAATAAASPLPSLDLLATVAINSQLVLDLGRVYGQPLSLAQAQAAAKELAGLVVKLGLVEASTQLLTTALKSHAATYLVGGVVQGLSAAYLTHLVGEGLMAYLESRALAGEMETPLCPSAIAQTLKALMQRTQQGDFLKALVQQGAQRLQGTLALARGPASPLALGEGTALTGPQAEPISALSPLESAT